MISGDLLVANLLHELTLMGASLITVPHLLDFRLHVPLHNIFHRLYHQWVHLGEQLQLHVLLRLLELGHFF